MSTFYRLAYATGFTPWERAGEAESGKLAELFDREEAERGGPGKGLDLGCGSGRYAAELAIRGWAVTGVELIPQAVTRARRRIEELGLSVPIVKGDVTRLGRDQLGAGYDFFLDVGCYHGLDHAQRLSMAQGVTSLAASGATLLMLAFSPAALPRPFPRGSDRHELEGVFAGWVVTDIEPASTQGMPKPLRKAAPNWYRLRYAS